MPTPPTWREAWTDALYGANGFSVRGGRGPRHDFSTSATRGPALARALAMLVRRLNPTGDYDVVDVGAGDGRLLIDLRASLPADLTRRGRFTAVELAPRPEGLPEVIGWQAQPPEAVRGLLLAHELLDTVPCEVVERGADGLVRVVTVDRNGHEAAGAPLGAPDEAWLRRWWPLAEPGQRADVGRPRDDAWRGLASRVSEGLAIAVDYGHTASARPAGSTLAGWSRGRAVPPVPDGNCDLTAHVAMDALLAPGDLLMTQREALSRLWPAADPSGPARARLTALAEGSHRRSLSDPGGLGGYLWLVHAVGEASAAAWLGRDNGA